jgi:hypothetical protein
VYRMVVMPTAPLMRNNIDDVAHAPNRLPERTVFRCRCMADRPLEHRAIP